MMINVVIRCSMGNHLPNIFPLILFNKYKINIKNKNKINGNIFGKWFPIEHHITKLIIIYCRPGRSQVVYLQKLVKIQNIFCY